MPREPRSFKTETAENDGCPLYDNASSLVGGGSTKWATYDAPASELADPMTSLSRSDYFDKYFMYKPTATSTRKSIWVSLAKASWQWSAKAQRTAAGQPWPSTTINPQGVYVSSAAASAQMPSWANVYNFAGTDCPSIP